MKTLTIYHNDGITMIPNSQINHVDFSRERDRVKALFNYSDNRTIEVYTIGAAEEDLIRMKNQVDQLLLDLAPCTFSIAESKPKNPIYSNPGESFTGAGLDLGDEDGFEPNF